MSINSGTDSVGLQGAKAIGSERAASLREFSWAARHDSSVIHNPPSGLKARIEGVSENGKNESNLSRTIDDVVSFCELHASDERITFIKFLRLQYGFTLKDAVDIVNIVNHVQFEYTKERDFRFSERFRIIIELALLNIERDFKNAKDNRSLYNNFIQNYNITTVPENVPESPNRKYVPESPNRKYVPEPMQPASFGYRLTCYRWGSRERTGFNLETLDDARSLEEALMKATNVEKIEIMDIVRRKTKTKG